MTDFIACCRARVASGTGIEIFCHLMIAMAGRQPQFCFDVCCAFAIDCNPFADQQSFVIVMAPYFIYANKQLAGDECAACVPPFATNHSCE